MLCLSKRFLSSAPHIALNATEDDASASAGRGVDGHGGSDAAIIRSEISILRNHISAHPHASPPHCLPHVASSNKSRPYKRHAAGQAAISGTPPPPVHVDNIFICRLHFLYLQTVRLFISFTCFALMTYPQLPKGETHNFRGDNSSKGAGDRLNWTLLVL